MSQKPLAKKRDKKTSKINALRKIRNCQECGISDKKERLFVHHIRPTSRGGGNTKENLMKVCKKCHRKLDYWALGIYDKYLEEQEENERDNID